MTSTIDFSQIVVVAAGIMTLLNLGAMVWTIFTGPARKLGGRVSELEDRVSDHDKRAERHAQQLVGLSQTVNAMPGVQQMHQLEVALSDIRGDLRTINATMEGNAKIMARLEDVVTRHEQHLLDGGKR
ncbi:hypothetical protein ROE7235_03868 [Roseibaca ekhonensis]|uniref:DUF2730 family protein n=2 Tax=Roseinatronobacter ekhonensis TaxID=254356 RepID=A0A3B0N233_9RHOB|nr:hypothetical protein ROE7235_03868 [Roseibaca ekhonensis]